MAPNSNRQIPRRGCHDEAMGHASLNRMAASATAHCLTGCAIGEVLGLVIGTALGWGDFATGSLAFALAVAFVAAWPVNRYLIARGKGHAVAHQHH